MELSDEKRNATFMDWWSLAHIAWGIVAALVLPPFWALAVLVLWEPLEILVLSRIMARFGVMFGHETLRNSLMDVVFDVVGVLAGLYLVRPLVSILTGG